MAATVYVLCAATSLLCVVLLVRGYRESRNPLLFWSAICFAGLLVNNVLLVVDLIVLAGGRDLSVLRGVVGAVALVPLLWGLVRISVKGS